MSANGPRVWLFRTIIYYGDSNSAACKRARIFTGILGICSLFQGSSKNFEMVLLEFSVIIYRKIVMLLYREIFYLVLRIIEIKQIR